ncbi:uncharacterized protein LOC121880342 [Homarus americanus]|uniref:uncharacterized protein LOC121880342 n=1 Tax=Homarus americanus TaxID=6706 RepID=UPI001C458310|nr:uncharacterized protein LOC121880342 [Homarus americanus]
MLVLQYLANASRRFHTFVENRLHMFQELSEMKEWRHVGTSMNPADDAIRGLTVGDLIDDCRWIHGPVFLWKVEAQWPEKLRLPLNLSGDFEVKQTVATLANSSLATGDTQTKNALYILWTRYSFWPRLLRGVAWLRRLKKWLENNDHQRDNHRGISVAEVQEAEVAILLLVQRECYPDEMKAIARGTLMGQSEICRMEPIFG